MLKRLSLVLLMFPTLGSCTMPDDHFYGNQFYRPKPVAQVELYSPSARMPAARATHGHQDMRHSHKHARNHHMPRRRAPVTVHGHEDYRVNNVHGHD